MLLKLRSERGRFVVFSWLFVLGFSFVFIRSLPAKNRSDQSIQKLCETLHADKFRTDPFQQQPREVAIHELARRDRPRAVNCLLKAMEDPFEHIRQEVVLWIGKEVERSETIRFLQKRGLNVRSPLIRRNVLRALGRVGDDGVIDSVREHFDAENGRLRKTAARVVRKLSPKSVTNELRQLTEDRAAGVEALRTIRAIGGAKDGNWIRSNLSTYRGRRRAEAIRTIGALVHSAPDVINRFLQELEHPNPEVRLMALRGLVELRSRTDPQKNVLDGLFQGLGDQNWRVRSVAIDGCVRVGTSRVIPELIDGLRRSDGRFQLDFTKALRALTDQRFGIRAEQWQKWWKKHRESITVSRGKSDWRTVRWQNDIRDESTSSFFDLRLYSDRVVFVIDVSGGMGHPVEGDEGSGNRSKLEMAQDELVKTIENLDPSQKFNVLLYRYPSRYPPDPRVQSAFGQGSLRRATTRSKRRAISWVRKLRAEGWGAFWEALEAAMEIEEADSIVFVSDGKPTRGRHAIITSPGRAHFFDRLQDRLRYRPVLIHTVLTGQEGTDLEFMQRLSGMTGGFMTHSR